MSFVQFRIHPSIGIARYGNSPLAYYVGSDFPQFMQELFPKTRNLPRSRTHPEKGGFAGATKTTPTAAYDIFNPADGPDSNYKDKDGKLKAQAARFRIFAYVYSTKDSREPRKVFEVDADMADITWSVELANRKTNDGTDDIDRTPPAASLTASAAGQANVEVKKIQDAGNPILGYMKLERKSADKTKFTGRMHLIGNPGEAKGTATAGSLWSDEWFDSGCDGPVKAEVKLKNFNAFKSDVTTNVGDELKYLDAGAEDPVNASAALQVNCLPAWVVVGPPDYSPDMGHFVSLWDIALDGAMQGAFNCKVKKQPKLHKQIHNKTQAQRYQNVDYHVHIHPQLCLFSDANLISGVARGRVAADPGHNKNRNVAGTDTPRGIGLNVRDGTQRGEMEDAKAQKNAAGAINDRKKPAIYARLRKPATLYEYFPDKIKRHFIQDSTQVKSGFPRKLGRRIGYTSKQAARHPRIAFPDYIGSPPTNLRKWHSTTDPKQKLDYAGKACGKTLNMRTKGPPRENTIDGHEIVQIDDMFWPVTIADMPLLRELAYTYLQHWQFQRWQAPVPGDGDKISFIFPRIVSPAIDAALTGGSDDRDVKFEELKLGASKYAPALLDMAHAGSALGGSFLPGIEVGREAGIALNWSMLHGATDDFPDIRFKRVDTPDAQFSGRLTKDLAIPWQVDFILCDEVFWPTSRPGFVLEDDGTGTSTDALRRWPIFPDAYGHSDSNPTSLTLVEQMDYFNQYWWDLGFVKRESDTAFANREVNRPP